jgi:predicted secreted Zn-dependent protease
MTTYSLTWQYQTQELGDGNCSLSDVKVGLHLSSTLPEWQSDAYAKNGLTGRWQRFMTALEQHEKGHAELDKKYAEQIAQDLQTIPASSCETLSRTADALIRVDTGALDVANHTYDRETQHGATQGAVIPTY